MQKILIPLLITSLVMQAAPVLVEAYQEGSIIIPENNFTTETAVEVIFSVDTPCLVQFSTSASTNVCKAWLAIDGDSLPMFNQVDGGTSPIAFTYTYLVSPGEHTVELKVRSWSTSSSLICRSAYLQALIFLPDTAKDAVADREVEPGEGVTPSVVSRGPYVAAPGATQLVDTAGRVILNSIEEDKIYLSELPPGTYFARDGERTITKVVKVE